MKDHGSKWGRLPWKKLPEFGFLPALQLQPFESYPTPFGKTTGTVGTQKLVWY
jgi:hypothetical protein